MAKLITRQEQEKQNTWSVDRMFESDQKWEEAFQALKEDMQEVLSFQGRLAEGPDVMAQALETIYGLQRRLENVYVYASMRSDEDTADAHYQDLNMRVSSLYNQFEALTSFYEPEALALGEDTLEKWSQHEVLEAYRRPLEELLRRAPHTLDQEQEQLLAESAEVRSAAGNAYNLLNNADMRFRSVTHNGEEVEITNSNFVALQMSSDRDLREKVYKAFYSSYQEHENTIASLFQSNIKGSRFMSKARKYPSNRAMYLAGSNIPEEIYDNLIQTVHDYLPAMHDYVGLRKEVLGYDRLHFHDVYASLVGSYDKTYTFDEAKELIIEALKPLGEEYVEIVRSSFEDRWMDIYPNKGKRSGAYSSGSYDSYPYMLLNFNGTLDSVFTLIHEMGHSVHSYLSHKNQSYVTAGYKIFVAEVASTCNEALLTHYLLENTEDPEARKYILNHYMDSFKSTLYRQTMFAEFERIVHKKVEENVSLTAPVLNDIYRDLNEAYFGPEMVVDEWIALEWARIPHFYRPFYVYQYATGFSAATALSQKILEEGQVAVDAYLKFLSSGSSHDPIELLEIAGVDMREKEPVAKALDVFQETIKQFRELL